MKFFKKFKSSNFWVSMISAVILILQAVFNVDIKTEYLNQIILGILGILVMTGIVTDSASDEVTVKQEFDMDKVKDTVISMFTQISSTLQTDMTKVVSQLTDATQNIFHTKPTNENIIKSNDVVVDKKVDAQVENIQQIVANKTSAEQVPEVIDKVEQVESEQEEMVVIQPVQEVVINQVQQPEFQATDAPKNEL